MPLIEPKLSFLYGEEPIHGSSVRVFVRSIRGSTVLNQLEKASSCHTEEGWVEVYITDPARNNKVLIIDGEMQKARLYVNFEVRHKDNRVLYPIDRDV